MKRKTKVWINGRKWRTLTLYLPTGDIQYCWGKYDGMDVSESIRMFGLAGGMDASHGQGQERWYHNIDGTQQEIILQTVIASARKADFTFAGEYESL